MLQRFLLNWCDDYSALRHCRNCKLTSESPQIYTRRPKTPDKGIGTLCQNCHTQEVFDGSTLSGKIEGSQTRVQGNVLYPSFQGPQTWEIHKSLIFQVMSYGLIICITLGWSIPNWKLQIKWKTLFSFLGIWWDLNSCAFRGDLVPWQNASGGFI